MTNETRHSFNFVNVSECTQGDITFNLNADHGWLSSM